MPKKKDANELDPLPPEDGQSGVVSLGETHAEALQEPTAPLSPVRAPAEGDTVVYVPHIINDNIGGGHCKATVKTLNADGTVDVMVHGPNGDFEVRSLDRGSDQTPRSYYWGESDAIEEGRGP